MPTRSSTFNTAIKIYQRAGVRDHGLGIDIGLVHEHVSQIALAEAIYLEGLETVEIED
ncbi:MAG: hypothetical protein WDO15_04815 [Bacteroidota bacterium]